MKTGQGARRALAVRVFGAGVCLGALAIGGAGAAFAQEALPSGGTVSAGSATITTGPGSVTVNQSSDRAVVNWNTFNVGPDNSVVFSQPSKTSATLNRVTGDQGSEIAGRIVADGSVFLINPNGIAITATGTVQTGGGFVASTLDVGDEDFMAGNLSFAGSGASGQVSNAGSIIAGQGAYVALLGGSVSNSGTISVPLGKVGLGSGEQATLDLNGDGFLQVAVPSVVAGNGALIDMGGSVNAAGGRVELKVASVRDAVRNVVNLSGTISANSATGKGGSIILLGGDGGTVTASGTLSAKGATGGGFVETSGANVDYSGLRVDTSSSRGSAGTWLVDPVDLTVDAAAAATISTNLATTNVTLQTTNTTASGPGNQSAGNGDISIDSAISWTSANTFSLLAYNAIDINAAITGTNGTLTLTAGNNVANTGAISASGAIDIGTFNLTNGVWTQNAGTLPSFRATDFHFNVQKSQFIRVTGGNGTSGSPYLVSDIYGLQGVASTTLLDQYVSLAADIDATGTENWNSGRGFVPIGVTDTGTQVGGFTGTFDGQFHTVRGLTMNRTHDRVGLFGYTGTGAVVQNINLIDATVTGGQYTGALIGYLGDGTVTYAGVLDASVTGTQFTGGLIGNSYGTVQYSYATGSVTGGYAGGLIGGTFAGSISDSWSSANVSVSSYGGGLVGILRVPLTRVYATGSVTGTNFIGGLLGNASAGASVSEAWASGRVTGSSVVGGLAGSISSSSVSIASSYWDTYSTGQASSAGSTGGATVSATAVTSDPSQSGAANYAYKTSAYGNLSAASNIDTATPTGWVFVKGNSTRPFLAFEVPSSFTTGTNAAGAKQLFNTHQFQLLTYSYTRLPGLWAVAADIDFSETGAVTVGTPASYSGMWAGEGWYPIGMSSPTNAQAQSGMNLDGQGYVLSNLYLNRPTYSRAGLFGIYSGNVHDLGLADFSITGTTAGTFAGSGGNTIKRVWSTGTVTGTNNAGGLMGTSSGVTAISESYSSATVSGIQAGGLVGSMLEGSVTNSYSTGSVTGTSYAGGLIGAAGALGTPDPLSITSSYASGPVSGTTSAGGLIGRTYSNASLSNSYWDSYSTGQASAIGDNDGGITPTNVSAVTSNPSQSGASNYAYKASAYARLTAASGIGTATPEGFVFMPGNSTRPFLAFEVPTSFTTSTGAGGALNIYNSHQLQLIGYDGARLAGNYMLANDIDLSETGQVSAGTASTYAGMWSGAGWVSLGTDGAGKTSDGTTFRLFSTISSGTYGFNGTFDGDGYAVSGLAINRANAKNVGLFGVLSGSATRLGVAGSVTGLNGVGGLAGMLYGNGNVSYATSSVDVTGTNLVGGLVGNMNGGSVSYSSASGAVGGDNDVGGLIGYASGATISNSWATGSATGASYVGGLIGYQYNSSVTDSYASSDATGTGGVGGLIGQINGGSVTNSYAVGLVSGGAGGTFGGLVGQSAGGATVTSSYWNTQTSGQPTSAQGEGKTSAEMENQSTFEGWDFTNTWTPPSSGNYPKQR